MVKHRLLSTNILLMYVHMPILLHAPAENIDKHGPSQLQQVAGPMYWKGPDTCHR